MVGGLSDTAVLIIRNTLINLFQYAASYTPNAVVELLPHRHCVGATLIAP